MNLFEKSKARGISSPYAQGFMAYDEVDGKIRVDYEKTAKMLAQDAALTTAANVGIPRLSWYFTNPSTKISFTRSASRRSTPYGASAFSTCWHAWLICVF